MKLWIVGTERLADAGAAWDDLHQRAHGIVFNSSVWLRILAEIYGRDSHCVFVRDGDGIRAGIPLLLKQKGMLRYSGELPMSLYSGLLHTFGPEEVSAACEALFGEAEQLCHFASLSLPREDMMLTALTSRSWELRNRLSLRLDLSDPDRLWDGYSQSLRRKIRRASEVSLVFSDEAPLDVLIDMYSRSYLRHGLHPPTQPMQMRAWLLRLRREGLLRCFGAYRADGVPAAARAVIRDGDMVYDWLAGADPAVSPSASHWLLHSVLLRYAAEGARTFDFMGANTPGVVDFKRSFGPYEQPYVEANWYRSPLVKTLLRLQRARLLRGRLL
jgi:CelD/BcsL family acetyltransferase involved in cellulose biosynthesis